MALVCPNSDGALDSPPLQLATTQVAAMTAHAVSSLTNGTSLLRLRRPSHKRLGDSLTGTSPTKELGEGGGGHAVGGDRGEEREHRKALAEVDMRDLLREANMPASRRPLVLLRLTVGEEQRELERLR